MNIAVHEDNVEMYRDATVAGAELIGQANGATNGFCVGVGIYYLDTYLEPGVHDDQEGFYVVEGTGTARVGNAEFAIRPGSAFIAQKGVPHAIKRDADSGPVKVAWSHGAV
jgi:mannose-6-phosphate isomerase-like protein (cupin superfamily)